MLLIGVMPKSLLFSYINILNKEKLEKLISSSNQNNGDPYGVRTHECSLERAMC